MTRRKKEQSAKKTSQKETWPLYSLQQLTPSRFTEVVGKILRGTYTLVLTKFRRERSDSDEPTE